MKVNRRLDLIEKYIQRIMEEDFLKLSANSRLTTAKAGHEKEWREKNEELEMLLDIHKELSKNENAPVGDTLERMEYLAKSILAYSVNIHVHQNNEIEFEITCFDKINETKLAKFTFNKIGTVVILRNYQLY